jgi:hypothetical protein
MANITIPELRPTGLDLFQDSESFLNDLTDSQSMAVQGGEAAGTNKYFEALLIGFGIGEVVSLAKSFSELGNIAGGMLGGGGR